MRVAGIMSGTSLDGIDVAIIDIGPKRRIQTLAHSTTPYPKAVRDAILAVSNRLCHTGEISRLNFLLPELYAEALGKLCERSRIPLQSIGLIGAHGQTIFHEGTPAKVAGRRIASTLQIGDGSVLAERTCVTVVSDFRTRDMAAGGKGAPLVPFTDYLLFHDAKRTRVACNIGGIGNITVIPAGASPEQVIAFDTGPGNMVMDQLITRATNGRQTFDRGGALASRGYVSRPLLAKLLRNPYYSAAPPKTAGREEYGEEFIARLLETRLPLEDLLATASALTASTIALAVQRHAPNASEVIVGGGGCHNRQLMANLAALLPGVSITTTADYGVDSDVKEAVAFALMAHETWHHRPSNLPSATGARRAVILGKISPSPRQQPRRVLG